MAAKEVDSDNAKKQELDDMTTCCICTGVYTDPKALPCMHTFCLKCIQATGLKTNKGPDDEMPCPICRRMFKIPPEGFHGFPQNSFIERLIQVANLSDQPELSVPLCDACVEENEEDGMDISAADSYCVDCNKKFCQECCKQHNKFKLTKRHRLIPMTEHESCQTVATHLPPTVCELHEQKELDVYCADCKTVVCAICFIDDHSNCYHKGSHVKKFVDDFRRQIESNVEAMHECRSKAEIRKSELLKVKEVLQSRAATLECDIEKRKEEVKQLAEKHAASLLQNLCSIRQGRMKEIQLKTDDVDTYLSSLDTYNAYCQNIMIKGSDSDICCAFSDLSSRATELQNQCQLTNEIEQPSNFSFRKSDIETFLTGSCDNLIGEIQDFKQSDPKSPYYGFRQQMKKIAEEELMLTDEAYSKIRKIIERPQVKEDEMHQLWRVAFPYIIQRMRMWNGYVLTAPNIADLIVHTQKQKQKEVVAESYSASSTKTNQKMKTSDKSVYPVSRLDCLTYLINIADCIVAHDILRIMSKFPMAIPLIIQDISEDDKSPLES